MENGYKRFILVSLGFIVFAGLIFILFFIIDKWFKAVITPEQKVLHEMSEEISKSKFDLNGELVSLGADQKTLTCQVKSSNKSVKKYQGKEIDLQVVEQTQILDQVGQTISQENLNEIIQSQNKDVNIKGTITDNQFSAEQIIATSFTAKIGQAAAKGSKPLRSPEACESRRTTPHNAYYADVPSSYWAAEYIYAIADEGITSGCSSVRFCPDDLITRSQMAVFLIRAMNEIPYNNPTPTFADVPKTHPAYGYIERFYQLGITSGCGTNPLRYCPDANVTRAQMAVFISRAAGIPPYDNVAPTFQDVPKTHSAYAYIEAIYQEGITSGCQAQPKMLYCPDRTITRAEMAVFITKAFLTQILGYVQKTDDIYVNYAEISDPEISGRPKIAISASDGFFISRYIKKGIYNLTAKTTDLVPFNVVTMNLDFGWKYSCNQTWITDPNNLRVAQPGRIEGRVIDLDTNAGISGAKVKSESKDSAGKILNKTEVNSNDTGSFVLDRVSPGSITLTATKENYISGDAVNLQAEIGQTYTGKDLTILPQANFMEGDIKTDTGEPLPAAIQIPASASFYGYDMTFATDWTGHYKAVGVKPSVSVPLTIMAVDFMNQTASVTSPSGSRQTVTFNFTFITSGAGTMVDTRPGGFTTGSNCARDTTNNIISDAYVVLSNGGTFSGGEYPEQKWWRKTDGNGCVSLDGIPAGIYRVYIFKDFEDGTTKYYVLPTPESQITIEHAGTTDFPLNGLQEVSPTQ